MASSKIDKQIKHARRAIERAQHAGRDGVAERMRLNKLLALKAAYKARHG